ncbi:MAG: flagellar filament capping protein FliD [Pseudomonadota bacterium]
MNEILATLGAGSGLDTNSIVNGLVAAERAPQIERLTDRRDQTAARISALGQIRAGIGAFSDALSSLIDSGVLGVRPALDRADIASAVRTGTGPAPGALEFTVQQLAAGQTLVSGGFDAADMPLGTGTLTISFGTVATDENGAPTGLTPNSDAPPLTLDIDEADATPAGLARLINDASAGLSATVVNDGDSARLILKGPDGERNGFTISAAADTPGSDLERLSFTPGDARFTQRRAAADAILDVEGIQTTRPTNRIEDLVDGVRIDLNAAAPDETISLSNAYDTEELGLGIRNFVGAFNEVQALLQDLGGGVGPDAAGPLAGSPALRAVAAEMRALTTAAFGDEAGVLRLADIGIASTRSGALTIDDAALTSAVAAEPSRLEALFSGLSTDLAGIADAAATSSGAIGAGLSRLQRESERYAEEELRIETRSTAYEERLRRQFGAMEASVAQFQSTRDFLTQQIDLWTNRNN